MKKSYKVLLIIVGLLVIICSSIFVYCQFIRKPQEDNIPKNEIKVTNSIDKYGYTLEDRDTELFKEKFEELKQLLNEENYEKEDYIKLVSELFIIDLFTIDNKISRYDIGGLEYVYPDALISFKSVIENSIYKTVENNIDKNRMQKLPIVLSTTVSEVTSTTYKMPDEKTVVDGYQVNITWTYEENLGYDNSASLILIPDNEKMSVVFYKPKS